MVWLDAFAELRVRLHDGDPLRVLCVQLRVHEQADEVVFGGLLEILDRESLETDLVLVLVLHELTHRLGIGRGRLLFPRITFSSGARRQTS